MRESVKPCASPPHRYQRRLERNLGILAVVRMKVDSAETDGHVMAEVAGPSIFKCQPCNIDHQSDRNRAIEMYDWDGARYNVISTIHCNMFVHVAHNVSRPRSGQCGIAHQPARCTRTEQWPSFKAHRGIVIDRRDRRKRPRDGSD